MKPADALTGRITADLSSWSLEDALVAVGCFPGFTLRVGEEGLAEAQRVIGGFLPVEGEANVVPRVNVVIDPDYRYCEWSVHYEGRVFWSPGA